MSQAEFRFGPFRLLSRRGPLLRDQTPIKLPPKALALLWTLSRRAGEIFTRAELLDAVWPGADVGDEALTFQVQTLRRAIEDDPRHPRWLLTAHRIGFRLAGADTELPAAPSSAVPPPLLVGRDVELRHLQQGFERALRGRRELIFITGEAGIGKTRLIDAFIAGLGAQPTPRHLAVGQCFEHGGDTSEPYLPLLEALTRLLRASTDETPLKLMRRMAPSWLLQLPALVEEEELSALRRQHQGVRQERMRREGVDVFDALSADRPLVLVLEDLHWADRDTLDLLGMLMRRRDPARLLVLCSYRPADAIVGDHPVRDLHQTLAASLQASHVGLTNLDPAAVRTYVGLRLASHQPRSEIGEQVFRRSAGHPLFLVQICDYLERLHHPSTAGEDPWQQALESEIPQGLSDLIELQLRRQALSDQLMLEVASVAGESFCGALIAAGAGIPLDAAEKGCERMARQGHFIEPTALSVWPDGTLSGQYRFRHTLYEHVLRQRLAPARRAHLHRQIALRLELAYGERTAEIAGELTVHFENAGQPDKALTYGIASARTALARAALDTVRAQVQRGLGLLQRLGQGERRLHDEIALHLLWLSALLNENLIRDPELPGLVQRLDALLPACRDPQLTEQVLAKLWLAWYAAGQFDQALRIAGQSIEHAVAQKRIGLHVAGLGWRAIVLHVQGRQAESLQASSQAIEYSVEDIAQSESAFTALGANALTHWSSGRPDFALARARAAYHGVQRIASVSTQCLTGAGVLGTLLHFRRDWNDLLDLCAPCLALAEAHALRLPLHWLRQHEAVAMAHLGRVGEGLAQLRDHNALLRASGTPIGLPLGYCSEAELWLTQADMGAARAALDEGLEVVRRHRMSFMEPELLRLQGLWWWTESPRHADRAQLLLGNALDLADSRGARSFTLRIAGTLAEILDAQDRTEAALALLRTRYAAFEEGHRTPDLLACAALIEQMDPTGRA